MNSFSETLGRRAIKAGFKVDGGRWKRPVHGQQNRDHSGVLWVYVEEVPGKGAWLPDFGDPASMGWLLARVRAGFTDGEGIRATPISEREWVVHGARHPDREVDGLWVSGATEADALVKALELWAAIP
jgi:hypothetical protein